MTGKEILEEEFEKAGMRGYKAEQVDNFLRQIAGHVDEQEVEKNDLIYKIKILADKIEEYKVDEGNIRDALLGAQKLGTSILNEAKSKAELMTREAKNSSDSMMAQAKSRVEYMTKESMQKINIELAEMRRDAERERSSLERMKKEVSNFKASLLKQYKTHLDLLSNLQSVEDDSRVNNIRVDTVAAQKPKTEVFDQDAAENIFTAAAIKCSEPQTITSDIVTQESSLEELEQTREFESNEILQDIQNEKVKSEVKVDFDVEHQRPNYMEKFGELKFGGFGKSSK